MASQGIRDWPRTRQRILGCIEHPGNRAKVMEFLQEREANAVKASTLANEGNALRDLCLHLGNRSLESVERKDITAFVNERHRDRTWRSVTRDGGEVVTRRRVALATSTLSCRKVILKCFYKWLRNSEDYPPEVRHLKTGRPRSEPLSPDELVTAADLKLLLQTSPDRRDKALLAVLYESGFRAGEICALNIGSVQIMPQGMARLSLPRGAPGLKTGARTILLWDSVAYLVDWLNHHPHRNDPSRALFYSNSRRAPMRRMTGSALYSFVQNAADRAGLRKKIRPHLFRHSAATERVKLGWTEAHLRSYFGWTAGSSTPSIYVHMAGADYERIEMDRRGLLDANERPRPALSSLICGACHEPNVVSASFCSKCSRPVSPEAIGELERRQRAGMRDELARLLASEFREQIATEVRKAVDQQGKPAPVK